MNAAYVFHVRFRLDPRGASVDPTTFETTMEIPADEPGTGDWMFFRNALWRGEVGDESHLRDTAERLLSVDVDEVTFRELRTDQEYLTALKSAIADDLDAFKADNVDEALHKYLGSSIHVRS